MERNGILSAGESERTTESAHRLRLNFANTFADYFEAIGYARRFRLKASFDSHLLALAARLGCEFWTTNKKLHHAVGSEPAWSKLVED